MPLKRFMRPKWKSGNDEVRLGAVREMDESATKILVTIIREDRSPAVRLAALEKINHPDLLADLDRFELEPETRQAVHRKINRMLGDTILHNATQAPELDENLLRIDDHEILFEIVTTAEDPAIREKAVNFISDEQLLGRILEQNCGKLPAQAALNKISHPSLLERASRKASNKAIRRLAAEKLAALQNGAGHPSDQEIHEQELEQYVKEAMELSESTDLDYAASRKKELERAWMHIDPELTHQLRQSFEEALQRFANHQKEFQLQQQEEELRREDDYAARIAAFEEACSNIEELIGCPNENAQARFDQAVKQWDSLANESLDAVFSELAERFTRACQDFQASSQAIAAEQQQLTELQRQYTKAATYLNAGDITKAASNLEELNRQLNKARFSCLDPAEITGPAAELGQRLAETQAAQEEKLLAIRQQRTDICNEIETLIEAENRHEAQKRVSQLRSDWKELPPLTAGEEEAGLKERFQTAGAKFNEQQQDFYHDQDWQKWAHKTRKEELCGIAESLDQVDDLRRVADTIKEVQAHWKETGPAPKKESDALWERFHAACDRNFSRCKPFFEAQEQLWAEHLKRKTAICAEAEALAESEEWRKTSEKLKGLQVEWKAMGFSSNPEEKALYKKLRRACDNFFGRRQKHHQQLDMERQVNYEEKSKLCDQAEALAAEPDWHHGKTFKDLQNKWRKIGQVPRDQEKEIWQRFRAACDNFFNWLNDQRRDNLQLKEALCLEVETLVANLNEETNLKQVAEKLSDLQNSWKEIGPVPNQEREKIWQRFHKPCDEFFQARRNHFEEQDQLRQGNQQKKEALLQQAEETIRDYQGKEAKTKLQELQHQWQAIGPAPHDREKELRSGFQDLCDGFFQGRRLEYEKITTERLANLKKKEAICLQLENILGLEHQEEQTVTDNQSLSLAEQFKLAREANFMLAGKKPDKQRQKEEVRRLQQEWKKTGPVPHDRDKALWQRYNRALDFFYQKNDGHNKKQPDKAQKAS